MLEKGVFFSGVGAQHFTHALLFLFHFLLAGTYGLFLELLFVVALHQKSIVEAVFFENWIVVTASRGLEMVLKILLLLLRMVEFVRLEFNPERELEGRLRDLVNY